MACTRMCCMHRTISSCDSARFSIVNLHSLGMDKVVEPTTKLEREENEQRYRWSSLMGYQHFALRYAMAFIETLTIDDADS